MLKKESNDSCKEIDKHNEDVENYNAEVEESNKEIIKLTSREKFLAYITLVETGLVIVLLLAILKLSSRLQC